VGGSMTLRCYAREGRPGEPQWVSHCIDLDVWASGSTLHDARKSLLDALELYIETAVRDHEDDPQSVRQLMNRRAPLRYIAEWHWALLLHWARGHYEGESRHPFRQHIAALA
jgi:predicted RNase H-like HicB family nuclease